MKAYGATKSTAATISLLDQLTHIKKSKSETMIEYISRVIHLQSEVSSQGEKMSDTRMKH